MTRRWVLPALERSFIANLAARLQMGIPAASVLAARGFTDPQAALAFLNPSLAQLHDPLQMAGMPEAVARLARAVRASEKILIYGDYDVDGTTSVVLLTKAIELAGGAADFHIPHRLRDGYGMRPEAVEDAAARGVTLIVSVDTGIRAAEVVRRASELGIDVIITDHHLPEAELPAALAVLNPNRPGCAYPEKNLCGAGVAFKLAQALLGTVGWPADKLRRVCESLLKLVAIATVADVVPLTGENRVIVKHGLAGLAKVSNPGLRAILDVAGFPAERVPSASQVAFQVAPRLNAAGRMDTASCVVELFLTRDPQRARQLAEQLHLQNAERQKVEAEMREACEKIAVESDAVALVYFAEDWHRGVLGIVAARLVERLHRPVFVLGRNAEDGLAQGSGRSIPAFHLLEALESMPDLFVRFGGHQHAAGVTLEASRVDEFRSRFNAFAAQRLRPEDLVPELRLDAVVDPGDLDEGSVEDVFRLGPFGNGHPLPLFASLGVEIAAPPAPFGNDGKHFRVMVRKNGRTLVLKAWNWAERAGEFVPGSKVDVAFTLTEDARSAARGYPGWSASLRDVAEPGAGANLKRSSASA
jgi:single-stranded-DNA-specific exonuclease